MYSQNTFYNNIEVSLFLASKNTKSPMIVEIKVENAIAFDFPSWDAVLFNFYRI